LGSFGEIIQDEEDAFAGAAAHIGGGDFDLWSVRHASTSKLKVSGSFSEEKEPKRLFYAGPGALCRQRPRSRIIKVFCALFFKKALLP
jgi:hypothetical protein